MSLRRRTGGDDAGWHLTLPSAVDPDARHELRIPLGRAVHTVPKRFRTTVQGLAGAEGLSAVATVSTRRTVWQLLDDDDRVLAEVADDHVDALPVALAGSTGRRSPGARSRSSSSRAARRLLDRVDSG